MHVLSALKEQNTSILEADSINICLYIKTL